MLAFYDNKNISIQQKSNAIWQTLNEKYKIKGSYHFSHKTAGPICKQLSSNLFISREIMLFIDSDIKDTDFDCIMQSRMISKLFLILEEHEKVDLSFSSIMEVIEVKYVLENCEQEFSLQTDLKVYSTSMDDSRKFLGDMAYKIPSKFVSATGPDLSLSYGCGRSFDSTGYNIKSYTENIESRFKYDLVVGKKCQIEGTFNFVTSFVMGSEIAYMVLTNVTCRTLSSKLLTAYSMQPLIFNDKFGWTKIYPTPVDPSTIDIFEGILRATFGFLLIEGSSIMPLTVSWLEEHSTKSHCFITCYYIEYVKVSDIETRMLHVVYSIVIIILIIIIIFLSRYRMKLKNN